jgi:hypothetical protein
MNYYLYKVFYFTEIPARLSLVLEDFLEKESGPCFGYIPFVIWSEEWVEICKRRFDLSNPSIIDVRDYFIDNGVNVGETILIKF